ncbi:cysteine-rich CWC family protein [Haliea alexandrii]|uniref:cysteine-rich CWC family protein n=1 Tax=Haliea alexandrii TaxID=2448162 RepID=UPI0018EE90A8
MQEHEMTTECKAAGSGNATRCPLCGESNACGVGSTQSCWCASASIPAGLIALVPAAARQKACICQACVRLYNQNPAVFKARCRQ